MKTALAVGLIVILATSFALLGQIGYFGPLP